MTDKDKDLVATCRKFGTPTYVAAADRIEELVGVVTFLIGQAGATLDWATLLIEDNLRRKAALEAMLQAVCGETGFAAAVRADTGNAYPWPALDAAEALALEALEDTNNGRAH